MESNVILCETRSYTRTSCTHHHHYGQLILPLYGVLSLETNHNELNLDENHLFYIPPECFHSFHSNNKSEFLVLDIPMQMKHGILESLYNNEQHQILDERWKAIRFLLQEEAQRANKNALSDLVSYAFNYLLEKTKPVSIQYIHDNFDKQLTIQKLASIQNFNASYYIEWFNKKTGMTPNAYIQKLRLKKAKEYLLYTDLSLLMISQLVGYEQQSSLTRLFVNQENISPSNYRKINRKKGKITPA